MSIYKLLLLRWSATLSLLFFLFVSCADRLDYESVAGEEPNVYVTLNLNMPGSGLPQTRMTPAIQSEIRNLQVLVFDVDDKFAYYGSVAKLEGKNVTVRLIASASGKDTYKLVLLGNTSDTPITSNPGELRTVVLDRYAFNCAGKWDDTTPLPLWGETGLAEVNESTVFTDKGGLGPVLMLRALARVDVGIKFTDPTGVVTETATGLPGVFTLETVRVYNSKNKGHIYTSTPNVPYMPSPIGNNGTDPLIYTPTAEEIASNAYCGNIFVPEATASGVPGSPAANFLVVGGLYGPTKKTSFYRIDFISADNKPLPLLRNNLYRVNITKVSSEGYDSAEKAAASTPANMTAEVITWNNAGLNDMVYDGQNYFSCASKKLVLPFLANSQVRVPVSSDVPASKWTVEFSDPAFGAKMTVTKPTDASPQGGELVFTALGQGGTDKGLGLGEEPTVTVKVNNLRLVFSIRQAQSDKVSPAPGSDKVPGIGGGTIVDIPPTDAELQGIPLSGANCFIANKVGTYVLNASIKGNGVQAWITATERFPANAADVKLPRGNRAEVLWETNNTGTPPVKETVVKIVSYDAETQQIIFTTTKQEGNAVIAVKDGSNNILWSWHIWRTNFDPEKTEMPMKTISGFDPEELVMMDRNLGALNATPQHNLSTGLFYQWGRKDPLPGSNDFSSPTSMATTPAGVPIVPSVASPTTDNLAKSIKQPTTFMVYGFTWTSFSDKLWGTPLVNMLGPLNLNGNKGAKTIYDPCPPGWRVPPAYAFVNAPSAVSYPGNGCLLNIFTSGNGWFPASGFRDTGGYITRSGARLWTSSPTYSAAEGERATCLQFSSASTGVGYEGRASGYNCRCIKELTSLKP